MDSHALHLRPITKILSHELLFCILIALVVMTIYGQTVSYDFLELDDAKYVKENTLVQKGWTWDGIKWAFNFQDKGGSYWQPLTWVSHMVDVTLFDHKAGYHHLMNVFWHILNTWMLFFFLRKATLMFWPSVLVASLFAVHPVNVESVAWVAERKNLLSTFFGFLSLAVYVNYAKRPSLLKYILLAVVIALGLMVKPMLITLPFLFLLLDIWPLERISIFPRGAGMETGEWRKSTNNITWVFLEKLPLIGMITLTSYLVMSSLAARQNVIPYYVISLPLRIENLVISYASYLGKLFWPISLAAYYPYPLSSTISLVKLLLCVFILIAVSCIIFTLLRKKQYLMVGWLWFLGTLIPVSGLVQAGLWPAMADRWAYLPYVGLFIAVAWSFTSFLQARKTYIVSGVIVAGVVVLSLGMVSWFQVHYWENGVTLFRHTLTITGPNNNVARDFLASSLAKKGRYKEAIENYETIFENSPNFDRIQPKLARVQGLMADRYAKQGEFDKAIELYKKALNLKPDSFMYNNLGVIFFLQKRFEEAISCFNDALHIESDQIGVYINLANAYAKTGSFDSAVQYFKKAINIDPQKVPLTIFTDTLKNNGHFKEAVSLYRYALERTPGDANIYFNLGLIHMKMEMEQETSIFYFQEALRINPNFYEAHNNLGILLAQKNKITEAIRHFTEALRIKPTFIDAHTNIGLIYFQIGKQEKALYHFQEAAKLSPNNQRLQDFLEMAESM